MTKPNFEFKITTKNTLFGVKNRARVKTDNIDRYINEGMDEQ